MILDQRRVDRITTAELITELCADEEAPWATYNRGKPMNPRQLARKLDSYGIKSKNLKLGYADVKKGFERSQFAEAFERYLSLDHPPENIRYPLQPNGGAGLVVADGNVVAATTGVSATRNCLSDQAGSGVADEFGESSSIVEAEI